MKIRKATIEEPKRYLSRETIQSPEKEENADSVERQKALTFEAFIDLLSSLDFFRNSKAVEK